MKTVEDLVKQHEEDLINAAKVLTDLMVKFGINNLSFWLNMLVKRTLKSAGNLSDK